MLKQLFLLGCWLISISACLGQRNSKFHHVLDQALIERYNFTLYRKTPDTTLVMRITKQPPFRKKPFKAVVILDNNLLLLEVWRILDLDSTTAAGRAKDEFGNVKSDTSRIVNAATPLTNSTLYLRDNRRTLGQKISEMNIPFSAWKWSISSTPFRYRLQSDSSNATLSTTFSLNASYGYAWGKTKFASRLTRHKSNTMAFFFGISTVELRPATVRTPVLWDRDASSSTADRTSGALSYGINYTRAINNFGLELSLGLDTAFGRHSSQWSYQNKPWLGLGVNTSVGLFK